MVSPEFLVLQPQHTPARCSRFFQGYLCGSVVVAQRLVEDFPAKVLWFTSEVVVFPRQAAVMLDRVVSLEVVKVEGATRWVLGDGHSD